MVGFSRIRRTDAGKARPLKRYQPNEIEPAVLLALEEAARAAGIRTKLIEVIRSELVSGSQQ
ncbi:hypothetical protein [Amycolatopsis circi]|uniref:hypothetical protein n=1 Tax=Amycolatopsis circi TaxID=871959 RepID=UPI000E264173|nr:hypothetical protein [Amycolatopsis circi]